MKKVLLSLTLLSLYTHTNAQVGIGTESPASTLDIKEKRTGTTNDTSAHDGIMIPKLTKLELAAKDATAYTSAQNGAIIYVSSIGGTLSGPSIAQVANIDAVGFYFLDATGTPIWKKLDNNTNLYNIDGTLSGTRTVNQGTNSLYFQDSNPRSITPTNVNTIVFGQDATTGTSDQTPVMALNSANRKVGINVRIPRVTLDIYGAFFSTASVADGLLIPKMTVGELSGKNINTYQSRNTHTSGTGQQSLEGTLVYIFPDSSGNVIPLSTSIGYAEVMEVTKEGLYYYGMDDKWHPVGANVSTNLYNTNGSLTGARVVTQGANTLAFTSTATNGFSVDGTTFSVDAANDRVGIGTIAPNATLDVKKSSTSPTTFADGIIPPNVTRLELVNKVSGTYSTNQKGALVYVSDISGTTTGASGSQVVDITNKGYYYFDDTISNTTAPNGRWVSLYDPKSIAIPIIEGAPTSSAIDINPWNYRRTAINLKSSITLGPGKWQVSLGVLLNVTQSNVLNTTTGLWIWPRFSFADSSTGTTTSTDVGINGTKAHLISGSFSSIGSFTAPDTTANWSLKYDYIQGSLVINNTSGGVKTYYLIWVNADFNKQPTTTTGTGDTLPTFLTLHSSGNGENYLRAMKIQ